MSRKLDRKRPQNLAEAPGLPPTSRKDDTDTRRLGAGDDPPKRDADRNRHYQHRHDDLEQPIDDEPLAIASPRRQSQQAIDKEEEQDVDEWAFQFLPSGLYQSLVKCTTLGDRIDLVQDNTELWRKDADAGNLSKECINFLRMGNSDASSNCAWSLALLQSTWDQRRSALNTYFTHIRDPQSSEMRNLTERAKTLKAFAKDEARKARQQDSIHPVGVAQPEASCIPSSRRTPAAGTDYRDRSDSSSQSLKKLIEDTLRTQCGPLLKDLKDRGPDLGDLATKTLEQAKSEVHARSPEQAIRFFVAHLLTTFLQKDPNLRTEQLKESNGKYKPVLVQRVTEMYKLETADRGKRNSEPDIPSRIRAKIPGTAYLQGQASRNSEQESRDSTRLSSMPATSETDKDSNAKVEDALDTVQDQTLNHRLSRTHLIDTKSRVRPKAPPTASSVALSAQDNRVMEDALEHFKAMPASSAPRDTRQQSNDRHGVSYVATTTSSPSSESSTRPRHLPVNDPTPPALQPTAGAINPPRPIGPWK